MTAQESMHGHIAVVATERRLPAWRRSQHTRRASGRQEAAQAASPAYAQSGIAGSRLVSAQMPSTTNCHACPVWSSGLYKKFWHCPRPPIHGLQQ